MASEQAVHRWYTFVLGYEPSVVVRYIERFGLGQGTPVVCDPFSGTGTTGVVCKSQGISAVGLEALPFLAMVGRTKCDWSVNPDVLESAGVTIAACAHRSLDADPSPPVLEDARAALLIKGSISPEPLRRVLALRRIIDYWRTEPYYNHLRVALARVIVQTASNLRFGPEVGTWGHKETAPVISGWQARVLEMCADLRRVRTGRLAPVVVHQADARACGDVLAPESIDAVITSPPYPNEKDYTRIVRLEAVLLDFFSSTRGIQDVKRTLVRSNTRSLYADDTDDVLGSTHPRVLQISQDIERTRLALGKTSGFERQYARLVLLYFGGMARHLTSLRPCLRPGARLAYVVGDQASYLGVPIPTGVLLGEIAQTLGYTYETLDAYRTRRATRSGETLREDVVVLRWPG